MYWYISDDDKRTNRRNFRTLSVSLRFSDHLIIHCCNRCVTLDENYCWKYNSWILKISQKCMCISNRACAPLHNLKRSRSPMRPRLQQNATDAFSFWYDEWKTVDSRTGFFVVGHITGSTFSAPKSQSETSYVHRHT